jgi:hypothetical protein
MKNLFKITFLVVSTFLFPKLCRAQMSPFNLGPIAAIGDIIFDNQTGNDLYFNAEINEAGTCKGLLGSGTITINTIPMVGTYYFIAAGTSALITMPNLVPGGKISNWRFGFNTNLINYCNGSSGLYLQDGSCSYPNMLHDNGCNTIGIGPSYVTYQFNGTNYDCTITLTP